MSCYIIRKLNESRKIPDELYKTEMELVFYPKNNKKSLSSDLHNVEELYDMEKREVKIRYFSYVANQIIHSHYFEIYQYFDETVSGFYFNSDRSRGNGIYYVEIDEFFEVLTEVARVYANGEIAFTRNAEGKFVLVWGE